MYMISFNPHNLHFTVEDTEFYTCSVIALFPQLVRKRTRVEPRSNSRTQSLITASDCRILNSSAGSNQASHLIVVAISLLIKWRNCYLSFPISQRYKNYKMRMCIRFKKENCYINPGTVTSFTQIFPLPQS